MLRVYGVQIKLLLFSVLAFCGPAFLVSGGFVTPPTKLEVGVQTLKPALKSSVSEVMASSHLPPRVSFSNQPPSVSVFENLSSASTSDALTAPPAVPAPVPATIPAAPVPATISRSVAPVPATLSATPYETIGEGLASVGPAAPMVKASSVLSSKMPYATPPPSLQSLQGPAIPSMLPATEPAFRSQSIDPRTIYGHNPISRATSRLRSKYSSARVGSRYSTRYPGSFPARIANLFTYDFYEPDNRMKALFYKIKALTSYDSSNINSFKTMFNYSGPIMSWFDQNINSRTEQSLELFSKLRDVMSFIFDLQFFSVFCDRIASKTPHYFEGDANLSFIRKYDKILKDLFIHYVNKIGINKFATNKSHNHNKTNIDIQFFGGFSQVFEDYLESAVKNNFVFLVPKLEIDVELDRSSGTLLERDRGLDESSPVFMHVKINQFISDSAGYLKAAISLNSAWIMQHNSFFDSNYQGFSAFKRELNTFKLLSQVFATFFYSKPTIYSKSNLAFLDIAITTFDKIITSLCSRIKNDMLPLVDKWLVDAFPANAMVSLVNNFINVSANSKNAPLLGNYEIFKEDSNLWDKFNKFVEDNAYGEAKVFIKSLKVAPYRQSSGQVEVFSLRVLVNANSPLGRITNAYVDVSLLPDNNSLEIIKERLNNELIRYFYNQKSD